MMSILNRTDKISACPLIVAVAVVVAGFAFPAAAQDQREDPLFQLRIEVQANQRQAARFNPETGQWVRVDPSDDELAAEPQLPAAETLSMVPIDPSVLEHVRALDGDDFHEREASMRALLGQSAELDQIYAVLELHDLSVEQRCRLIEVVRHRLMLAPRGALGVRWMMNPRGWDGAVEITDLVEGMPAQRVLRVGDRITHIDGSRLTGQNDMAIAIQEKPPGQVVKLTIDRPRRDERGEVVRSNDSRIIYDTLESDVALSSVERLDELSQRGLRSIGGSINSSVQNQRAFEAKEASMRYSPEAKRISVPPRPVAVGAGHATRDSSFVNQHPAIARLLKEREMIQSGRQVDTPQRRLYWQSMLSELVIWANEPGIDGREREHRQAVLQRFKQLLPR